MRKAQLTSSWLSAEMARALAAGCPPLLPPDVVEAADALTGRQVQPAAVICQLLERGTDLMQVRRLVEALQALRDYQT